VTPLTDQIRDINRDCVMVGRLFSHRMDVILGRDPGAVKGSLRLPPG